jgi:arylformamidase
MECSLFLLAPLGRDWGCVESGFGFSMRYYDISVPIHAAMPVYGGDPPVEVTLSHSIGRGDQANVSRLLMGAHTGTHVDAPRHFVQGARTVDEIPLDVLIGPVTVVDLAGVDVISAETMADVNLEGVERVLFKTTNSELWREDGFQKKFVHMTGDAAEYLVGIGIKLVGIDYLSVEEFGAPKAVAHLALLRAGTVILEGVNLAEVPSGKYKLICLPLLIQGCDGAPCRAVLVGD